MVKVLVSSIICLITLNYAQSRWIPITKSTPKLGKNVYIPEELGLKSLVNMRIPNKDFCAEMYKKSFGQYLVITPWWYDYCEDLRERNEKKQNEYYNRYRWILEKLKDYRRNGGRIPEQTKAPTARTKRI